MTPVGIRGIFLSVSEYYIGTGTHRIYLPNKPLLLRMLSINTGSRLRHCVAIRQTGIIPIREMDLRLIAAALSPENKAKIIGVSFGMKGNNESFLAGEVAKCLDLRYIDFELSPQLFIDYANASVNITEGQDIFAQGYLLYVCDQLRRDHDVEIILDGMEVGVSLGGDQLKIHLTRLWKKI